MSNARIKNYLATYAEPEAREVLEIPPCDRAVVIPTLFEGALPPGCVDKLAAAAKAAERGAVAIIVVNSQETHSDDWKADNQRLLEKLKTFRNESLRLFVVDRTSPGKELPPKSGVGLARKIGCDIALSLFDRGLVHSPWIHTTDADAHVDNDYFSVISDADPASALVYHYSHLKHADGKPPIFLYELHLRHYVRGLFYAGSPYAYNTIGSLIAFQADSYAAVRGFPKRDAGEDFYFLNKLRKIGEVRELRNRPIQLLPRTEVRVPFGTTRSQVSIDESLRSGETFTLYDPMVFVELRKLLLALEKVVLTRKKLSGLSVISRKAWMDLKGDEAVAQALKTRKTENTLRAHLFDWFDGFRTLKFVHYLTEAKYPKLPWESALDSFDGLLRKQERSRQPDGLAAV